jgi:hypothetical protein
MFFTRRSGQRIGTGFIFYRKVRPCSQLHRPNTKASQVAKVHFSDHILKDEGRIRDGEHIVGANSTLHYPAFLPPGCIFAESFQDTSGRACAKWGHHTKRKNRTLAIRGSPTRWMSESA